MPLERGFSLLELLVAATLLAVVLLGLGLLAVRALHDAASLRDHALAGVLMRDLRARADLVGHARLESGASGSGFAGTEFRGWRAGADSLLPSVSSELCRDGGPASPDVPPISCDGSGPLLARLRWRRNETNGLEWRQEVIRP
jgi:prepilin-type N-terminal cleavage/methylation domain-containing protein